MKNTMRAPAPVSERMKAGEVTTSRLTLVTVREAPKGMPEALRRPIDCITRR